MNNKRAIELQRELISLSNKSFADTSVDSDRFERANNEFEIELAMLPSEAKQLDKYGYIIPWER